MSLSTSYLTYITTNQHKKIEYQLAKVFTNYETLSCSYLYTTKHTDVIQNLHTFEEKKST